MYGVDPEFGRKIDVDLSEERMKRSWEAYKIRWEREEERRRALEEKKLVSMKISIAKSFDGQNISNLLMQMIVTRYNLNIF